MRHKLLVLLSLVACLFLIPSTTFAQSCDQKCDAGPAENTVRIDARNGQIHRQDTTTFPTGAQVTLLLYNKNPFKYTCEIKVSKTFPEGDVISSFLTQASILSTPKDEAADKSTKSIIPDVPPGTGNDAAACTDDSGKMKDACNLVESAKERLGVIKSDVNAAKTALKALGELKALVDKDPECAQLCTKTAAVNDLGSVLDLKDLSDSEAQGKLNEARELLEALDCNEVYESDPDAISACKTRKGELLVDIGAVKTELQTATKAGKDLYTAEKGLAETWKKRIDAVNQDSEAFTETFLLPKHDVPVTFSVELVCTEIDDSKKKKTFNLGQVRVGTSRFSVSAGVGVGFIEQTTFGSVPSPGEGDAVKNVFAVTDQRGETWGAVSQLNARLKRWKKGPSFHWSLGLGTKNDDGATTFSFYTGPSLGFIDDQLFFTFGYYQDKVKELSGFKLGDDFPSSLNDQVPVREKTKGGLLFTVTYKLR